MGWQDYHLHEFRLLDAKEQAGDAHEIEATRTSLRRPS
jgi:hypothetical protein